MPDVTAETVVARRPEPLTAAVDDELVMLDIDSSTYFGLDRVGRRIWGLIEEPASVEAICVSLEREFDVAPDRCRAEVIALVEQLAGAGLVDLRD